MAKQMKRYTEAKRAQVLAYFRDDHTAAETAEKFGLNAQTVTRWAGASGTKSAQRAERKAVEGAAPSSITQLRTENQRLKIMIADLVLERKAS